jgi:hypothetical protein
VTARGEGEGAGWGPVWVRVKVRVSVRVRVRSGNESLAVTPKTCLEKTARRSARRWMSDRSCSMMVAA